MPANPIDEAVVMLEALQERWCDSTTGKPGTRRIATFDAARGAQGEDDFDSEVSATRRCASDLALAIERIRALTAAQQQGQAVGGWPLGELNRQETLKVLREHNAWRRGGDGTQTDPRLLGLALDAAIAAITAPPPSVAEEEETNE